MIAVFGETRDLVVDEFFELFKTPRTEAGSGRFDVALVPIGTEQALEDCRLIVRYPRNAPVIADSRGVIATLDANKVPIYGPLAEDAAVVSSQPGQTVVTLGYDLFGEIEHLLTNGQPSERAAFPTIEIHIDAVRGWMLDAGVPVVEIPPVPNGYDSMTCLTHDVDFFNIRDHGLDHSVLGFLYRATIGSLMDAVRGKIPWRRAGRNLLAALGLPLVWLGLNRDPWNCFDEYADLEREFGSTFFIVPFAHRPGRNVEMDDPSRRATRYQLEQVQPHLQKLAAEGFEIGLHGIDAWIDSDSALEERNRISECCGTDVRGVRMHWLLYGPDSPTVLESSGFDYDSTWGYNDTVGFKSGTAQAFKPLTTASLLQLPLVMQDTALFYPAYLGLDEASAWDRYTDLSSSVSKHGGTLTTLWHMRSLAPERLWGDFYGRVLADRKTTYAGPARDIVAWYRRRRDARFVWTGDRFEVEGASEGLQLRVTTGSASDRTVTAGPVNSSNEQGVPWPT